ncbi:MAG: translocation/assembly module TamB domain-containing protein [Mariprofundaceae bacterium]|nr:translocation/assembly module TamB domain-containing protein [Mariprofundaceae bacterium]
MKKKLVCFLTLLLMLLGLIWLGSSASLRWYAQAIETMSDGMVRLENLQGHPLWELHAEKLVVQKEGVIVTIHQPHLTWSAWQLLWGRVHIEHAHVSLLEIEIFDIETPSTFALTDLNFLRFFETETLAVTRLIYKDSAMTWALNDLKGTDVAFGRNISGQVLGTYEDTDLALSLNGAYQQWDVVLHWMHEQETRVLMNLHGFAWEQGKLHLQTGHEGQQLDGRWSHQGNDWQLVLNVSAEYEEHVLDGHAVVDASPVDGAYRWHGQGRLSADYLKQKTWLFDVHGAWNDQETFVRVEDQTQLGNWLNLSFEGEKLAFRLHTQKWQPPLQGLEGWLSADAWLWLSLPQYTWQASVTVLDSELMALPVALQGEVSGEGLNWQLEDMSADFLGVNLLLQGQQYEGQVALHLQAQSEQVKKISAFYGVDIAARLDAELNVRGLVDELKLDWNMNLADVKAKDFQSQNIQLTGEWQPQAWLIDMAMTMQHVQWLGHDSWPEIKLNVRKDADKVRLSSQAKGRLSWLLSCEGQPEGDGWIGKLEKMQVDLENTHLLQLKDNTWSWQNETLKLDKHTLLLQGQQAEWQFEADAKDVAFSFNVDHVNLAQFNTYISPWQVKEAPTAMQVLWQGRWNKPMFDVTLKAKRWFVLDQSRDMAWQLKQPQLRVFYQNQKWQWKAQLSMHERDQLHITGQLPWLWSVKPWHHEALSSTEKGYTTIRAEIHDMDAWQHAWLSDVDVHMNGDAYAQLTIENMFAKPVLKGHLDATLSHIQLAELGVDIQASLKATWQDTKGDMDLKLQVGTGKASLHGDLFWPWYQSEFDLVLDRFPLRQLNDNTIISDGQLHLQADQYAEVDIQGVLSAKKMILSFPDALPQASQDIVWKVEKKVEKQGSLLDHSHLSIDLILADDAKIVGEGMEMGLKGQLHLGGTIAQPEMTGDILVHDGFFVFRHVKLAVQEGSHIIFTGDMAKPRLSIRVAKQQEDMLLGVHISGTLDAIQSVFYSDPAMTQTEILAYLATGKSLSSMEGNDLSMAASVATFFLNSDGNVLMKIRDVLQQTFGIDSLDWEITPSGGRVVAGKKLNQRLNVQLEQSLQAQASTALTLEYILVRGVAIFARQMSNQSPVFGLRYRKVWNEDKKKNKVQVK